MKALKIILGMTPTFIAVVLLALSASNQAARSASNSISAISFNEFDANFSTKRTDLEQQQDFEKLKGKHVIWEGIVHNATKHQLFMRHKLTTYTYDVIVEMSGNERLASLTKGTRVRYEGTIENYGGAIAPHRIADGKVISSAPMTEVEQAELLHDSELGNR